ncbi:hypothetical protein [Teredinibacter sp. KSP-S5-2]|uniref:hypothetical protein n=1 Tax=Teredinibacter sp. KSP-S5-2 TaxID=3034506 RepID=UPI002935049F|nr:hypothetical protein [Teredinibacter sp. KSP-S5-2]WNO10347.1 hypothetical protein P5V12_04095 [Teredinibacter sp. KSP-S5-2]
MKLLTTLIFILFSNVALATSVTCSGEISRVGFLPMYGGKVIAFDTTYQTEIWAKVMDADTDPSKTDMVMSMLLAATLANKPVSIRFKTLGATSCETIEKYTGGVLIERIFLIQ